MALNAVKFNFLSGLGKTQAPLLQAKPVQGENFAKQTLEGITGNPNHPESRSAILGDERGLHLYCLA